MKQLSNYQPNPDNPRIVRDKEFRELKKSIQESPWMMALRPIIVDEAGIILAGRQRWQACRELKMEEVPDEWILSANELTEEQKREFIIKDNVHAGSWDFEALANQWDSKQLTDWGLVIPAWTPDEQPGTQLLSTSSDLDGLPVSTPTPPRPLASSDPYAMFEQVMLVEEKKELLTVLNEVKSSQQLEKLSDALMYIIRYFTNPTAQEA